MAQTFARPDRFYEVETTINDLPVSCELSITNGQLTLEAVKVQMKKLIQTNTVWHNIPFICDILDIMSASSIALLQTKCQELWEEEEGF